MSTLDKINSELSSLQEELSQLHHYTEEIGKAQGASESVVKMSKDFISSFQKRVEEINKAMAVVSADFMSKCNDTSISFETANTAFKKGISEAKSTLNDVGAELSIVADKVNELAVKIESINILGHFEKIHASLIGITFLQDQHFKNINSSFEKLASEHKTLFDKNRMLLYVLLVCAGLGLALGGIIVTKVF